MKSMAEVQRFAEKLQKAGREGATLGQKKLEWALEKQSRKAAKGKNEAA